MAATGPAIMPTIQIERLYQRVDEVEEMSGKRWARRSEVRRGGERAGARRSSLAAMATAALRLLLRAGEMKEAERVQSSGEAAGRRPFQSGQHTARSGQFECMAATRLPSSVAGRP